DSPSECESTEDDFIHGSLWLVSSVSVSHPSARATEEGTSTSASLGACVVAWVAGRQRSSWVSVFAAARTEAAATSRGIAPGRNCRVAAAAATNPAGTTVRIRRTGFDFLGARVAPQAEAGQRHPGEPDAEFLQRCATGDRLSESFC